MNVKTALFGCLLSTCVLFSLRCTKSSAPIVGNSSQTPNALTGSILEPDGKTPAADVRVYLRLKSSLPVFFDSAACIDTASTVTNAAGRFSFAMPGNKNVYVIDVESGNNGVFIDSIAITRQIESFALPPDTLKPTGAIKGVVRLAGGGDPSNVYVLAFGINRFAIVKSDGSFVFYPLAKGKYDLRIISTLENYGVIDTNNVPVASSDTTDLGILELPFSGIPVPKSVSFSYDTMKQIATIRWNKTTIGTIKSFNVYRRNLDSSGSAPVMLNKRPVLDTFFVDTTCVQDVTYGFSVAAVDTFETIGNASSEIRVKAISAFIEVDNAPFKGKSFPVIDVAIDKQNNFWIFDNHQNIVSMYSPSGNLVTQWTPSENYANQLNSNFAVDAKKNIYLIETPDYLIQQYDSSGHFLHGIDRKDLDVWGGARVGFDDNGNIYLNCDKISVDDQQTYGNIVKKNPDLKPIASWKMSSDNFSLLLPGARLVLINGKIYCSGFLNNQSSPTDYVIDIFDTAGTALRMVHLPQVNGGWDYDFTVDKNGQFYWSDGEKVLILDANGKSIGKFAPTPKASWNDSSGNYIHKVIVLDNNTVLLINYLYNGWSVTAKSTKIICLKRRE
jgi:hypothetical protein